jgi:hypothetical protein
MSSKSSQAKVIAM